jgi:hypothetical protein
MNFRDWASAGIGMAFTVTGIFILATDRHMIK